MAKSCIGMDLCARAKFGGFFVRFLAFLSYWAYFSPFKSDVFGRQNSPTVLSSSESEVLAS